MADIAQAVFDEAEIRPVAQDEKQPPPVVDARLAVDGNAVELAEAKTALLEAVFDRLGWEAGPVLDAPKASSSAAATSCPSRTRQAAESP